MTLPCPFVYTRLLGFPVLFQGGPMAKKTSKPKAVAKSKPPAQSSKPKGGATSKRMTKSQIFAKLSEDTGLSKKQVNDFFEKLTNLIKSQVSAGSVGEIVLPPGLIKIKRTLKKARPARPGINPKTKEPITIAAQPERTVIKAFALK